jgi:hypothetical protein
MRSTLDLLRPFSGLRVCVLLAADPFVLSFDPAQAERTQRMKIQWKFADGTTSEVEVNEELGNYITASRREESNLDRKERYHCYSLDAIDYEGLEYATDWIVNPKSDRNYKVQVFLNSVGDRYPSVPCRRMLLNQCT